MLIVNPIRTMRKKKFMLLNSYGHQNKPIQKNRQEQYRFTFDVSKCDRIFDELLRDGNIKLSHAIPPLEELKRRAYCKWHNSFCHATNDCNIFRRQIQSAINEGRLALHEMQVGEVSFLLHTIDLNNAKVLIRPEQAEGAKGKNMIIGEERPKNVNDKILARKWFWKRLLMARS